MAAEPVERRNSSTQLLQELEALSQSLYHSHNNRRTASVALPSPNQTIHHESFDQISSRRPRLSTSAISTPEKSEPKGRSRRMSLSPWRSRPKEEEDETKDRKVKSNSIRSEFPKELEMNKGLKSWKAIRAISHIGMQKLSCLFSVEVIAVQGLPASMNGLRLAVHIRKQETKDGAVQTMPARVLQGASDFEETLFIKCHVYCSGKQNALKFEPRPFLISVIAVDAEELKFGKNLVDLSSLIQESMEKSFEGVRVRQWDTCFDLSGKAKGGELVLKLGFQIMEKDGGIYNQLEKNSYPSSSSIARKQSKSSFSVPSSSHGSPKIPHRLEASTPSQRSNSMEFSGMDELNLDEPPPPPPPPPVKAPPAQEQELKIEENDLDLEFDVVDKGIEIQTPELEEESSEAADEGSVSASSEVVKEVVLDPVHQMRLTELDSIAKQIKALESVMGKEDRIEKDEIDSQQLDADEETVTREFLQMLEEEEHSKDLKIEFPDVSALKLGDKKGEEEEEEAMVFLPDLGKSLGSVVQTRDGGFLCAMNPLDVLVSKKEPPRLAMQISKPVLLSVQAFENQGFEILKKLAVTGVESLCSEVLTVMCLDEITGKTAEQVAFEGIASAIISGRKKEGASSSAARSIATLKTLSAAMISGRKERISTGIWNVGETPVGLEEVLAFALPKIETMAVEALKIQAEMSDEEPPFDVFPVPGNINPVKRVRWVSSEEWLKKGEGEGVTMGLLVQLRDPLRRFEQVGAPMIALVNAARVGSGVEEEMRFKVGSVVLGGLKVRQTEKRHVWDSEKQRLMAAQWLLACGLGKSTRKRGKHVPASKVVDYLWSISARVMADMWLKPTRNPDVKFPKP